MPLRISHKTPSVSFNAIFLVHFCIAFGIPPGDFSVRLRLPNFFLRSRFGIRAWEFSRIPEFWLEFFHGNPTEFLVKIAVRGFSRYCSHSPSCVIFTEFLLRLAQKHFVRFVPEFIYPDISTRVSLSLFFWSFTWYFSRSFYRDFSPQIYFGVGPRMSLRVCLNLPWIFT